jgi:hypothetical protein
MIDHGGGGGGNDLLKDLRRNSMGKTGFCKHGTERSVSVRCGAFTQ